MDFRLLSTVIYPDDIAWCSIIDDRDRHANFSLGLNVRRNLGFFRWMNHDSVGLLHEGDSTYSVEVDGWMFRFHASFLYLYCKTVCHALSFYIFLLMFLYVTRGLIDVHLFIFLWCCNDQRVLWNYTQL